MKPDVGRPILRYFGGKWMLAPWIMENMPAHRIYIEPFGGGGSVLIRKPKVFAEIYNDLDGEVVNVFRVLRDQALAAELQRQLYLTPYSRDEFEEAYTEVQDPVERARRTLVRAYMGFGSNGVNLNRKTGFRAACTRQNTTASADWANYPDQVMRFHERLKDVVIENRDAKEIMAQQDISDALHFVDPPYVHDTRVETNGYRFEMTDDEHRQLAEFLAGLKGMVLLCGYETDIYDSLGWEKRERESYADGASAGQKGRTEVLWMNPACVRAQAQIEMCL